MAEVKDFRAYARKFNNGGDYLDDDDASDKQASLNERIRNHRLQVFFRALGIVAFTLLMAAVIYITWRDKEYSEAMITVDSGITNGLDAKIISLGECVVQYSKDGVSCINSSGQQVWNQTYEMQSPIAHTCNNVVAIGDYNGHHIYVSNTSGALGSVDTNLPIRDFCVSGQGVVAAVLDGMDVTWIYLYDSTGNTLASFKTTMKSSGYPIAISLSPNAELLCVSYLYPEEGSIKTSVAFFNFGSVGQNEIDNYASGYDYPGVVVPYVQFMNAGSAFALSDDRIMFYSGDQKPVSQAENLLGDEEVRSVYFNHSYVGLVFANNTEDGDYRLQVYDASGNKTLTTFFDIDYTEIFFTEQYIIIYNEDECIVKNHAGQDKYTGSFEVPVRAMIPTNLRNKFTLVTSNNIETMILK